MFWLLPWVAILVGLGTTSTVATYVAVAHLGILERVAAFGLRRGLKGLTLQDAAQAHPEHKVTRLKGGIVTPLTEIGTTTTPIISVLHFEWYDTQSARHPGWHANQNLIVRATQRVESPLSLRAIILKGMQPTRHKPPNLRRICRGMKVICKNSNPAANPLLFDKLS
jgi:hypothetical protein